MALAESYKSLFLEECSRLTRLVCEYLETLERNPSDSDSIEKMVNVADVIHGGAKFLQDEELAQSTKILIELFKGAEDVRERQKEFELVCDLFRRMAGKLPP